MCIFVFAFRVSRPTLVLSRWLCQKTKRVAALWATIAHEISAFYALRKWVQKKQNTVKAKMKTYSGAKRSINSLNTTHLLVTWRFFLGYVPRGCVTRLLTSFVNRELKIAINKKINWILTINYGGNFLDYFSIGGSKDRMLDGNKSEMFFFCHIKFSQSKTSSLVILIRICHLKIFEISLHKS